MGVVSEMLGMDRGRLVEAASDLLEQGDRDHARLAAMLANDGSPCPFTDAFLAMSYAARPPRTPSPTLHGWRPKPGRTGAAASVIEGGSATMAGDTRGEFEL